MLFNIVLEYIIRRVPVNQEGMKLNGTHQFLDYADDVNILGGILHSIKKNKEILVVASKQTSLEINAESTEYMVMSREKNPGHNHDIKNHNESFERVEQFKYFVNWNIQIRSNRTYRCNAQPSA